MIDDIENGLKYIKDYGYIIKYITTIVQMYW